MSEEARCSFCGDCILCEEEYLELSDGRLCCTFSTRCLQTAAGAAEIETTRCACCQTEIENSLSFSDVCILPDGRNVHKDADCLIGYLVVEKSAKLRDE